MRRYGCWAGGPEGTKEDKECCIAEVYDNISSLFYQCQRKKGYGGNVNFCKQHAKMIAEGRSVSVPKEEMRKGGGR